MLLAHFFKPSPYEQILDLGSGCGIISLILAYRWPRISIAGLELQPRLAELARQNIAENHLGDRVLVVEGDLREIGNIFESASFDRVVCNPPYRKSGASRLNPEAEQAIARHEVMADLDEIVKAGNMVLVDGGRFDLIYPSERAVELQEKLLVAGCPAARLREIYAYPGALCRLVLVEAVKGGGGSVPDTLAPLYVRNRKDGEFTAEMAGFYEP